MSFFGLFGPPNIDKLKAKRDVRGIINALKDEYNAEVRRTAARALGELRDVQAVQPLISELQDEDQHVRQITAWALGEIGDVQAVEMLIAALKDTAMDVRGSAGEALGKLGDVRAVVPLIQVFRHNHSERTAKLREYIVEALGNIGDAGAVEALILALKDPDWSVRQKAMDALGKIDGSQATKALIAMLQDPDPERRRKAVQALTERGWQPVDGKQRAWWAIALEEWDRAVEEGSAAIGPLIKVLKFRNASLQCDAGYALGAIGNARAVEPLITVLKNPNATVRRMAAEVLGSLGDASAVEPLIALLPDSITNHIRVTALRSLASGWNEDLAQIPRYVAEALGKIGDARAIPPLIHLLISSVEVKKEVGKGLGIEIGGRSRAWTEVYWIANAAREALVKLLGQSMAEIPVEELRGLSNLERRYYFPGLDDYLGTEEDDREGTFIDFSYLIKLAGDELVRRGA